MPLRIYLSHASEDQARVNQLRDELKAKETMQEAWHNDLPDDRRLRDWFFQGKPLELARHLRHL